MARRVELIPSTSEIGAEDEALADAGLIDADDVELDRDILPGEQLFDFGDGTPRGQFSATATASSSDPRHVVIYDVEGNPFAMPLEWAERRLQKRYPGNHPKHPHKRVFYRRAPVERPVPTFPCPATWGDGCRKVLYTAIQRDAHFQSRHRSEWRAREAERKREMEERSIAAQEQQAALMSQLLARMAGGDQRVVQQVREEIDLSALAPEEPLATAEAEEPTEPELYPPGEPNAQWKIQEMKAWCIDHDVPLPQEGFPAHTKKQWLEHIDQELGR